MDDISNVPAGAIPVDQFESAEDKYSTPGQMIKTAAEGASKGFLGSTITGAIEHKLLGVDPADTAARAEENPITSGLSQAAGFGTGLLTGTGEAALMGKVGEAAVGLTGVGKAVKAAEVAGEIAPYAARVGSEALKQATEMAIMGGDDVLAKKLFYNPQESAESALSELGLTAALGFGGGAFMAGAASPLWKATVGPKVEGFLSSLSSKMGGSASETSLKSSAQELFDKAGLDPATAPSVMAKINGDPTAEALFSKLSQTDTTIGGKQVQKEIANLTNEVGGKMAETLGRNAEYVEGLENSVDKYTRGSELAETLHSELSNVVKPISEAYDQANASFLQSPLSSESKRVVGDRIAQKALDNGWYKSADDGAKNLANKVLDKLPEQETAEDLKKFISNLRESHPFGSPTYGAAKDISTILKDAQEHSIMQGIATGGGDVSRGKAMLSHYEGLRKDYARLMDTIDGLNEHLHVGKYYGPQSFLNNLKEMGTSNAEGLLSRLSGTTKADTLNVLSQFPETLDKIRGYHADHLLASSKNAEGILDPRKVNRNFDKLSPQVRDLIADKGNQERLKALNEVIQKTNDDTHNWSNTARTIDKLTHGAPSALSLLAALMGHGAAGLTSFLGQLGIKEGSDAARYGLLKFLGSDKQISAPGFKAAVEFIQKTIKGESNLNKAVESVFKSEAGPLNVIRQVTKDDLTRLDRHVAQSQEDQNKSVYDKLVNSEAGHYMPDHKDAFAQSTVQALEYLKKIKPNNVPANPLDKPMPVSPGQQARYDRALTIAQNPLVVLEHVKNGTLQLTDIQDLQSMYPSVYSGMQQKLTEKLVHMHQEADPVPYKTRVSLGLFMQHPLDATMTPQAIMAAQPKPNGSPQQQSAQNGSTKHSMNKLGKSNKSYMTATQDAESDRTNRD